MTGFDPAPLSSLWERQARVLIVKTGAAGDVLRTTPLLRRLTACRVDWLTAPEHVELIPAWLAQPLGGVERLPRGAHYDVVLSLEDDAGLLREVFGRISARKVLGAYVTPTGQATYSAEFEAWFDMGLIGRYGLPAANRLKLRNTLTYQQHLFRGCGLEFAGEEYVMPVDLPESRLTGEIAFAPESGARWPMKRWRYHEACIEHFSRLCRVNILPMRQTLREHISDVKGHRVVVCNDSLPMHVAIGLGKRCVAFFTCTSPAEIHGYGRLTKLVSPRLEEFFYRRDFEAAATEAIPLEAGIAAIQAALNAP